MPHQLTFTVPASAGAEPCHAPVFRAFPTTMLATLPLSGGLHV
jgi:hypothetical protein